MIQQKDLTFTVAALREFKKITGESPFNASMLDPDMFSALAYVGLRHGKYAAEGITQEESDKIISYNEFAVVSEAFKKSYSALNKLSESEESDEEKK